MITNIKKIKEELINYEEIESIFDLKLNDNIKYITLKGDKESFYLGGIYLGMGDNKIFLYRGGNNWCVPISIKDNQCNIIYKSRFFVEKVNTNNEDKITQLKNIIKKQNKIINSLQK